MSERRMTRRRFLALGMSASLGAALAACQPAAAPTQAPEKVTQPTPVPAEEKKIEFWGVTGGDFAEGLRKRLEEAKAEGKGYVDYVQIPGGWTGMTEKMNAAVAAKSVPDLAGIKDFRMKGRLTSGELRMWLQATG